VKPLSYFLNSIGNLPKATLQDHALNSIEALNKAGISTPRTMQKLVHALAGHSDFLSSLIQRHADFFAHSCDIGPKNAFNALMESLEREAAELQDKEAMMSLLRRTRGKVALLCAMADITEFWDVQTITARLSAFADAAIRLSARLLLQNAHHKGLITLKQPEAPHMGSGLLILAMGKLGGHELNYSSDIDLIILYDEHALEYKGRQSLQHFYNHLAQDLTTILQERTRDGYVFRTDLRLRPDPRSTPLAVKLSSAITYYETLGQNWERAAMIKARASFADPEAEAVFAKAMQSYIWRRHLDFEAINDIHSIKRQINARVGEQLEARGHNVKLGRGGIREIEFYIQTQQLIWGGRDAELRLSSSDAALKALFEAGHINSSEFTQLRDAYWFLRRVEHYIQMLHDQQTHTVPEDDEQFNQLSSFLGYRTCDAFGADLLGHCRRVHDIYAASMQSAPPLSHGGNLVFTGVEADPDTLRTLLRMGFSKPQAVSDTIQSWHRGRRRATRSLKARQLLTELTPALLTSFSETANPDDAFKRFDEFISKVPVGTQIFSLLTARPRIMNLLAIILGSAPAVGESLARNPALLDILLDRDQPLLNAEALNAELATMLDEAQDTEEALGYLRHFKQEKSFHAGVKLLAGDIDIDDCGRYLSQLADAIIAQTYAVCISSLEAKYGHIEQADFAVLGLGKLGTNELTFGSDLDVILLYNAPEDATSAGGTKAIESSAYFQRLASRLTHAFTSLSPEGRLYELDMRLRPGGNSGPLATHIDRLSDYFQQDGWAVEALGLTRARVVFATSSPFSQHVTQTCISIVERGYHAQNLADSICHLRARISEAYPTNDPWNIKYARGGLMDISFIAQYLRLVHPHAFAGGLGQSNSAIFAAAAAHQLLPQQDLWNLMDSYRLQRDVQHVLRLCSTAQTITQDSSLSLQKRVALLMQRADCDTLERDIKKSLSEVLRIFESHMIRHNE
jgi:glutamate-ammonia-ligase adenylyltransferase